MPNVAQLEMVVQPPLMNVRVMRTDKGDVCGMAQIQTQRGPLTFTATANEDAIHQLIQLWCARALEARGKSPAAAASGALHDWAKDMAAKITRANVISKLVDQAKRIGKNPQIARAVGLSTVVVPGTGSAIIALQSASELLSGLTRKDPKAIASWRNIEAAARAGNVKARRSVHVMHAVANAPRIVAQH